MKQKIYFLMLLFASVFTLGSCSSDDEQDVDATSSIVGTWSTENDSRSEELQFLADGTCYENFSLTGTSARMRYTGSYSLNGNKLTIHWIKYQGWNPLDNSWMDVDTDPETIVVTVKITETTMTFLSMEGEKDNSPVIYTRK